jgi:hypothetical protein
LEKSQGACEAFIYLTQEEIMTLFKPVTFLIPGIFLLLLAQGAVHADVTAKPVAKETPLQVQKIPNLKLCPDLRASLILIKGGNGLVTIRGTVTNIGKGDYNMASVAEVIMNLSYAPQYSYAKTGVSDILVTKPFTTLKPGATFPVNTTFQIPDFGGWASGSVQGNAKRLFTLRVVKQNMSPYKSNEDCNPGNNNTSTVVAYRDTKH